VTVWLRTYVVLVQGECTETERDWAGFWTAREIEAPSETEAEGLVLARVHLDWATGPSADLGRLIKVSGVATWKRGIFNLRRTPSAGHTFYNDSLEAQQEALSIELEAVDAPKDIREALLNRFR
jgi:hypothetical protein